MQSTEVIEVIVPEPPMGCSLALSDRGALCTVEAVQPASRAAGAGVREGDVLLTANGQAPPIESESERALVDFFRRLRYPLRLAFARRAKDARFGDAARRFSSCASSGKGGALGQFRPGQMSPAFDALVFDPATEIGEVYVCSTQFGTHLVKVLVRTGDPPASSTAEMAAETAGAMAGAQQSTADEWSAFLDQLRDDADGDLLMGPAAEVGAHRGPHRIQEVVADALLTQMLPEERLLGLAFFLV